MTRLLLLCLHCCLCLLALPGEAAELRLGLAAEVSSLDPHYLNAAPNIALSSHLYDTLVGVDREGRLVPALALSWRAVSPTVWEFRLRPGVRFHDGTPLTAADVLYSLERPATLSHSPGPFTPFTKTIVAKRALSPLVLRLTTAQPYGGLPLDLASIFIVARHAPAGAKVWGDGERNAPLVGSGPYTLERFQRGGGVQLKRFDGYWGPASPWERVTLRFLPNDGARLAALLAGDVDGIEAVPAPDIPRLKIDPRFTLSQRVSWRTLMLQLDLAPRPSPDIQGPEGQPLRVNPLRDARVRQALSLAIDRRALCHRLLDDLALPAANLVAPGIPGYRPEAPVDAYDPARARRLLAEAGYPRGFRLTLHGPRGRYIGDERVLLALAQFFSRIGIATQAQTLPYSLYFGRLRQGQYSAGLLGWGSLAGDFALRSLLASPSPERGWGTWNWGGYTNLRLDQALAAALTAVQAPRREAASRAAMTLALADRPVLPLYHQVATWAWRRPLNYGPRVDEFTFAWQVRPQ